MTLIKQFKVNGQLSKWRKSIQHEQEVLIIDGKRIYRTEVNGFNKDQVRVLAPDHYGLILVDLCCVFPVK
jgi:hypothetical protein